MRLGLIATAVLLSACSTRLVVPRAGWSDLRMGMSYSQVIELVSPPDRKLQPGERLVGAVIPVPGIDVYVWRTEAIRSAAFSDYHLNGFTH
jgi:hypothetical protein